MQIPPRQKPPRGLSIDFGHRSRQVSDFDVELRRLQPLIEQAGVLQAQADRVSEATNRLQEERAGLNAVQKLLDDGASPSSHGDYNYTALMWAIVRRAPDHVHTLLEAGADVDIHAAALLGDGARVTELLQADSALANAPTLPLCISVLLFFGSAAMRAASFAAR